MLRWRGHNPPQIPLLLNMKAFQVSRPTYAEIDEIQGRTELKRYLSIPTT
jgi:hypothetical protein